MEKKFAGKVKCDSPGSSTHDLTWVIWPSAMPAAGPAERSPYGQELSSSI